EELGDGVVGHQVAAPAAEQHQRTAYRTGGVGQVFLVALAVAGQLVHQAAVPVPVPAAVRLLAQDFAQCRLALACASGQVCPDRVGGRVQRGEAVREGGDETEDA